MAAVRHLAARRVPELFQSTGKRPASTERCRAYFADCIRIFIHISSAEVGFFA